VDSSQNIHNSSLRFAVDVEFPNVLWFTSHTAGRFFLCLYLLMPMNVRSQHKHENRSYLTKKKGFQASLFKGNYQKKMSNLKLRPLIAEPILASGDN
jgi:hypothetical protein